jgi:hypothetical protein
MRGTLWDFAKDSAVGGTRPTTHVVADRAARFPGAKWQLMMTHASPAHRRVTRVGGRRGEADFWGRATHATSDYKAAENLRAWETLGKS